MQISPANAAYAAQRAGFRGEALVMAVAIALAENTTLETTASSANPDGNRNIGIWQIDTVNAPGQDLTNPYVNAQAAYRLSGGGTSWRLWETYASGAYRQHLPVARAAAAAPSPGTASQWQVWGAGLGAAAGAVPGFGGLASPLSGLGDIAAVFKAVFTAVADGKMWRSLGWLGLGVLVLLLGVALWAYETLNPLHALRGLRT